MNPEPFTCASPTVHGKFLSRGNRSFFLRAMRVDSCGGTFDFVAKIELRRHMDRLRAANANAIVASGAQAEILIDLAAAAGLDAILEIEISDADLAGTSAFRETVGRVSRIVSHYRNHPAVMGFLLALANPEGAARLNSSRHQRRLAGLLDAIHREGGARFAALRHLAAQASAICVEEDIVWSTLPATAVGEQTAAIRALHNRAGARPVIVEFESMDADYGARISAAFQTGAAGILTPAYTPPVTGGLDLRCLQPPPIIPFAGSAAGPVPPAKSPLASVIVCAFNASRTLEGCLESLLALDYPHREVIVVDDGSTDETAAIASRFDGVRLLRQPQSGLGAARNHGAHAARGEIIAFTDADCIVDPRWLTLLVEATETGGFDLCGGPNYTPHEDRRAAACVAAAPGAPCHVLTADDRAEHLTGCNLALRASALRRLGGFDPRFKAAGDDVDICWRALDAGMRVGFSPAAFVWHHRRNSARAYYRQQRGYGAAEALLYRKYPERFNALGQIAWRGLIPDLDRMLPFGGTGAVRRCDPTDTDAVAGFEPPHSLLRFLPQSLEWHAGALTAGLLLWSARLSPLPVLAMLLLSAAWALHWGWYAPLERPYRGLDARLRVSWLAWSGPLVRAVARYRGNLTSAFSLRGSLHSIPRQRPRWRGRRFYLAYDNQASLSRDKLLVRLTDVLRQASLTARPGSGWDDYDLEIRPGAFAGARVTTADEEHEGSYRKNLVIVKPAISTLGTMLVTMGIGLALALVFGGHRAAAKTAAVAAALLGGMLIAEAAVTARLAYLAVESAAQQLGLKTIGKPLAGSLPVRPSERMRAAQGTS